MRKCTGFAALILGFFLLFFGILTTNLHALGTNAGLYLSLQKENGLPQAAGLTEEELLSVDAALADYLAGEREALEASPFQPHEIEHMEDVFDLFALLRTARTVSLAGAALLLVLGLWLTRAKRLLAASIWGLGLFLLPVAALAVWALIDFTGLFTAFHHLMFDNMLWLLDPAKDLLLMLCPERFFSDFAGVIAVRTAAYCCAVPLALWGVHFGRKFK